MEEKKSATAPINREQIRTMTKDIARLQEKEARQVREKMAGLDLGIAKKRKEGIKRKPFFALAPKAKKEEKEEIEEKEEKEKIGEIEKIEKVEEIKPPEEEPDREKIEESLRFIAEKKESLKLEKERLLEEMNQLTGPLEEILKKEMEIEKEKQEVEKREKSAVSPKEKKETEKIRWEIEEKRREIEKGKWDIEHKIEETKKKIQELDLEYREISGTEEEGKKKIEEVLGREAETELMGEKRELEKKLSDCLEEKEKKGLGFKEISAEKEKIDRTLNIIIEEEEKIEKEIKNIENEEILAKIPSEKQKIEKKRWEMEQKRQEIERKRWKQEEEKKKIEPPFEKEHSEYQKLIREEDELRKGLEKIDALLLELKMEEEAKIEAAPIFEEEKIKEELPKEEIPKKELPKEGLARKVPEAIIGPARPLSRLEKIFIRLIIVIILCLILTNLALFMYWYLTVKKPGILPLPAEKAEEIISPEEPTPSLPEITIPPSLFPIEKTQSLEIKEPQDILVLLRFLAPQLPETEIPEGISLEKGQFTRILIKDSIKNQLLGLKEFFEALQIKTPDNFYPSLNNDFTLFVYPQEQGNRMGFVAELQKKDELTALLKTWEPTMEADFEPFFVLMGKKEPGLVSSFRSVSYKEKIIRYQTFSKADFGICYVVSENYFIFTSSLESIKKVIDSL